MHLRHLAYGVSALCLLAGMAHAQSAETESEIEEVVVTGTQLRGVAPVGAALISLGQEEMKMSGTAKAMDLLRLQPQVFDFGISENNRLGNSGGANITYGNAVNLRGLSPFATLTLVNGHRATSAGTLAHAPDPSNLPSIILQRVEIIADGASATYGADAIAGVVNLVMRRNGEGLEVDVRKAWADAYNESQIGVLFGRKWGSGQVTFAAEYTEKSNLNGLDRDFFRSDLRPRGGSDYRVSNCFPGNIVVGGVNYAIPAGGVTPATANQLLPNTRNLCDTQQYGDLLPDSTRMAYGLTFDQDLGERVRIFGDAYHSYRHFKRKPPMSSAIINVPSSNPFYVAPPGTTPPLCPASAGAPAGSRCVSVQYWFGGQGLGNNADAVGSSTNYMVTGGTEVKLPFDWRFTTQISGGFNFDKQTATSISTASPDLIAALARSNPATAVNPFGTGNSEAVLRPLYTQLQYTPGKNHQTVWEAKFDGPLFELPGGTVQAAFGYQYRWQSQSNGLYTGSAARGITNNPPIPPTFARQSAAYWGEILIPLVGEGNAMPGVHRLDVDLGIRRTHYSILGSNDNPKIGVNWYPVADLKLHGSYGTSFRAPLLSEINPPQRSFGIRTYSTPTGPVQGYFASDTNNDLKPETATTWGLGGEWNPSFAPNFRASLNFFRIDYKDQISDLSSNTTLLLQPDLYAYAIIRCPSAACTQRLNYGLTQLVFNGTPIPLDQLAVIVNVYPQNVGRTIMQGLDYDFSYRIPTDALGDFTLRLAGTYVAKFHRATSPTAPLEDRLNQFGFPLRHRVRGSVSWNMGEWTALASLDYKNSYLSTLSVPVQTVDSMTTLDLHLTRTFETDIFGLDEVRLDLDVRNALNKAPPFANYPNGGFDPQIESPIGRLVAVQLSTKF